MQLKELPFMTQRFDTSIIRGDRCEDRIHIYTLNVMMSSINKMLLAINHRIIMIQWVLLIYAIQPPDNIFGGLLPVAFEGINTKLILTMTTPDQASSQDCFQIYLYILGKSLRIISFSQKFWASNGVHFSLQDARMPFWLIEL